MKVDLLLHSLFCFKGEDNAESEPYMWTIMFALDGSTIKQVDTGLTGTSQFFFGPGSHGNMGSSTQSGVTQHIPAAIGRWEVNVDPVRLTNDTTTVNVPPVIGVIGRLFEETLLRTRRLKPGTMR
jgi:hypothetical protein